ncbi:peptidoglycan-binding protein [Sphingomonas aerophila]|uniref:Peptidoglycan-binding protein n=1 Tax=Sphingomonas aerophila TaxID=1344948 RepID=A0A7W9BAX4_9SPHN|nr:peptidoglycan-binding protein [Sphingomonas aerophila]MBB5713668.1 hypothetical protein [Sphingomonas aerophila]
MTTIRKELQALTPPQRAELIYSKARADLSNRLWRAALGDGDAEQANRPSGPDAESMPLDSLLALFEPNKTASAGPTTEPTLQAAVPQPADLPIKSESGSSEEAGSHAAPVGLGANARHAGTLADAASRTGIPAPALAAIVNAEAAKGADGSWLAFSRNPRSSAAGLGQFLSSTWEGMASSSGTWLNSIARSRGWIGDNGHVLPSARSSLLQMRYDAEASINTVADYARRNLDGLRRAGVPVGSDATTIAQSAYLGHHLGLGDAIKFAKGGLDPARARQLLCAQIGTTKASQEIAQAGNASVAHRAWYLGYVSRQLRPDRFAA